MFRILTIFGTRPEAIKLAPVILALREHADSIESRVCVTAQHREMLDQVLNLFGIVPDRDLDLMRPDQKLPELTACLLKGVGAVLEHEGPDVVLVQGDTTSAMAAAMAAFYAKLPVGHVEAGLRSNDRYSPFPEEINRRLAGVLATLHFAPTETARQALLSEGALEESIFVTGNTVIDALQYVVRRPCPAAARTLLNRLGTNGNGNGNGHKLILVTAHRRENFGARLESICLGVKALAERNREVRILYPVHRNPQVREPVYRILGDVERVLLTDPVEYDVMAQLMKAAYFVLTDSGGIQEEAPALGKPVLVLRTETERPEAVAAGTARLVGPNAEQILTEGERLVHDSSAYENMAHAVSPYGDGRAAERIVNVLARLAPNGRAPAMS